MLKFFIHLADKLGMRFLIFALFFCLVNSCEKFEFSVKPPSVGDVTITNSSPSHSALNLSFSNVSVNYKDYCILENSSNTTSCHWVNGSLPNHYNFVSNGPTIVLSIFIRDRFKNISQIAQTNSIVSIPYLNSLIQYLKPDASSSVNTSLKGLIHQFSVGLDTDGTTLAASAPGENGTSAIYLFEKVAGDWTRVYTITEELEGGPLGNTASNGIRIDGDTLIVAAGLNDTDCIGIFANNEVTTCGPSILDSGSVLVYRKVAGTWIREAYINSPYPDANDQFGYSVALEGDTLAVGVYQDDGTGTGINAANNNLGTDIGVVYVYRRIGSTWALESTLKPGHVGTGDMMFGVSVALSGSTLVVGAQREDSSTTGVNTVANVLANNSGAAFVFVRDLGGNWTQEAYIKPSNTGASDLFGRDVDIEGDVIVAGAVEEDTGFDDSGAVYVFRRTGVTWAQEAMLKASDNAIGMKFGFGVRISGTKILASSHLSDVGAVDSGSAYVFSYNGAVWAQDQVLKASNFDTSDQFGYSVAMSGSELFVGSNQEDSNASDVDGNEADNSTSNAGAVYAFDFGASWTQTNYIKARGDNDFRRFARSLASDGTRIVVGAPTEDGRSGAAYVFLKVAGVWVQEARLTASNRDMGDQFGNSVIIDGDTILIGAPGESSIGGLSALTPADNSAAGAGAVYEFRRIAGAWTEQNYIKALAPGASDNFGNYIAWSGDTLVTSAHLEDSNSTVINAGQANNSASNSGAAYVFRRSGAVWSQEAYLKAPNAGAGDAFGVRFGLSGNTLVIGAPLEDSSSISSLADNSLVDSGIAYIFTRSGATWSFDEAIKSSNIGAGDRFGNEVDHDGAHIAVAAIREAGDGEGIGGNPLDNSLTNAGAVYVFKEVVGTFTQEGYLKSISPAAYGEFGIRIRISNGVIAIGTENDSSNGEGINPIITGESYRSGSVSLFKYQNSAWIPYLHIKSPNVDPQDRFGYAISLVGDQLVVGAPFEDSSGLTGGDRTLNNHQSNGAAYFYDLSKLSH